MPVSDPRLVELLASLEATLAELTQRLARDGLTPPMSPSAGHAALESLAEEALRARDG